MNASLEFVFCNREFGEADGSDEYINYVTENNINLITLSSDNFQKNQPFKFGFIKKFIVFKKRFGSFLV